MYMESLQLTHSVVCQGDFSEPEGVRPDDSSWEIGNTYSYGLNYDYDWGRSTE